jgi:hypothetical protein
MSDQTIPHVRYNSGIKRSAGLNRQLNDKDKTKHDLADQDGFKMNKERLMRHE